MAGNFHHAPDIGARSRSPDILEGVCRKKKEFLLTISTEKYFGHTLVNTVHLVPGALSGWLHSSIIRERRQNVSSL